MAHFLAISPNVITIVIAALLAIIGCIILVGKGDWLIAGYNTASKEEKAKVNIKRLRWLTAIICWSAVVFCMLLPILHNTMQVMGVIFGFTTITLLMVILANTWAKKK